MDRKRVDIPAKEDMLVNIPDKAKVFKEHSRNN